MMTAPVAADAAIPSDSLTASSTCASSASSPYHLVENPDQTVTSRTR